MSLSMHVVPIVWGVLVVMIGGAGCGGVHAPGALLGADSGAASDAPAAANPDTGGAERGDQVGPIVDAPLESPSPADAESPRDGDRGRDGGAREAGTGSSCTAGHACQANTRCQRPCFGDLVSRCSCTEGRFVCTGCIAVDGGAGDARAFDRCTAGGNTHGRRCDRSGSVCQYAADAAGQKLCVCANVGPDRLWICQ